MCLGGNALSLKKKLCLHHGQHKIKFRSCASQLPQKSSLISGNSTVQMLPEIFNLPQENIHNQEVPSLLRLIKKLLGSGYGRFSIYHIMQSISLLQLQINSCTCFFVLIAQYRLCGSQLLMESIKRLYNCFRQFQQLTDWSFYIFIKFDQYR